MTVTDTSESVATEAAPSSETEPSLAVRLAEVIATGEHKVIGRLYIGSALLFTLFTLVIGVMFGFEQADLAGADVVGGGEAYLQIFGLWRTGLIFLSVVPLFIGIAMVVVPLQVGAPSIAFPRLAAASFWLWLLSGITYAVATLADGGYNAGGSSDAIELTVLSMGLILIAVLAASVCIATTIIAQRTEGMSLSKIPAFSWSMLVASALWLLALPVIGANLALLFSDLQGDIVLFFRADPGASGGLGYLAWLFEPPTIFIFAVPLLGILADIVPVAAKTRQPANGVVLGAIAAFGILSFGAYAQPTYNARVYEQPVFVMNNLLLLLPLLVFVGALLFTLKSGSPKGSLAAGIAGGGLLMLLAGALAGAVRVIGHFVGGLREIDDFGWVDDFAQPFDDLAGTAITSGQFRYVLLAGLIGGVAGLYWWAPKIFGNKLSGGMGGLAGLALVGGTVLASLSEVINGFLDEPDVAIQASVDSGVETLNLVSAVGLAAVAAGILLVMADSVKAGMAESSAEEDPWEGHTLEWATASPPIHHNFTSPIAVNSATPLLDEREADSEEEGEES